jgi:hypothetical protein
MAPEIISAGAQPSIPTDLHALGVLLYQILLFRHPLRGPKIHSQNAEEDDYLAFGERALYIEHPNDKSNRPRSPFVSTEALGPDLQLLFQKAFVEGLHNPVARPQAASWERALVRMADRCLPCVNGNCEAKAFPYVATLSPACPWCHTIWNRQPQLALLDLYRPVSGRHGQYAPDNWQIIGSPGHTLYEWHVYPDRSPGPDSNTAVVAQFDLDRQNGQYILLNQSQCTMTVMPANAPRQSVLPGGQFALQDGMRVLLADENDARLAFVRIANLRQ